MKRPLITITFFLLFVTLVTELDAQYRRRRSRPGQFDIRSLFHSVDFNLGYRIPSMDYWNDVYLKREGLGEGKSFDGGLMFQGGLELEPVYTVPGILIGLYGGSYSDNVKFFSNVGLIPRHEKLTYRITPLTVQAKYEFTFGDMRSRYRSIGIARLHPYVGGGINLTLITQTLRRDFEEENREDQSFIQNGTTITYSGIVGVKYDIGYYFGLGVEMNYYFGSYDQYINTLSGDPALENISITGPCFNGKFYIRFPRHWSYYNYRRPRRR